MICKQTTLQNCCLQMTKASRVKLIKFSLWSCSSKTKFKDFPPTLFSSKDLRDEDKQSSNFLTKLPRSYTVFLTLNVSTFMDSLVQCINNFLTFMGPCILMCFYRKVNQMRQCLKFILFWVTLYMFRTVFPSIIRS